jgi:ribonuclease HI
MLSASDQPSRQTKLDLNPSEGVALFTDGSAWSGDGSGGWAWIAIDAFEGEDQDSGFVGDTTNNRMEMLAWIEGLMAVAESFGACEVLVYSDSEYVGKGAMDRKRSRVKNRDLWELIDEAIDYHSYVEFIHVRGHDGHPFNERVDKLAGEARRAGRKL